MERHTVIGHGLLTCLRRGEGEEAARIALNHHERYDGGGYPRGLAGGRIPVEARIVAVADVFDALLSDRPYRRALPASIALATIAAGSGSQFDPEVAGAALGNADMLFATRERLG